MKPKYTFLPRAIYPTGENHIQLQECVNIACNDFKIMTGNCKCFNEYQKLPGVKKIIKKNGTKEEL